MARSHGAGGGDRLPVPLGVLGLRLLRHRGGAVHSLCDEPAAKRKTRPTWARCCFSPPKKGALKKRHTHLASSSAPCLKHLDTF